jgi:hypothetical protein
MEIDNFGMNTIVVTNEEKELFQNMELIFDAILLPQGKPYSLLVAGGWVRDKVGSSSPYLRLLIVSYWEWKAMILTL